MKKPLPDMNELKLCYVRGPWAFFTTQDVTEQWGDDWNDVPYEHNAGEPYTGDGWEIVKVAFDIGDLQEPCAYYANSPYSVEMINRGAVPWLTADRYSSATPTINIFAGATLSEFDYHVFAAGGCVYYPG